MPVSRLSPPELADNRTNDDCSFRAADFTVCPDCGGAMRLYRSRAARR
jgi:ssDNA-binding Zn-finger/Zn-ribbon topoisomerase 1